MMLLVGAVLGVPAFAAPAKYLEYVQSKSDLYVDIDYVPKCDTIIECEVAFDKVDQNHTIFCSRDSGTSYYTLFYINNKSSDNFRFDYYNSQSRKADITDEAVDTRYFLRTSNAGLELFGTLSEKIDKPATFTPQGEMILFDSYPVGTKYEATGNYARMKMYSFRIFDMYPFVC